MAKNAKFVTEEFSGKVVELFSAYPAIDGSMLGLRFQMDGSREDDFRIAVPYERLAHFAEALLRAVTETQENYEQHRGSADRRG